MFRNRLRHEEYDRAAKLNVIPFPLAALNDQMHCLLGDLL